MWFVQCDGHQPRPAQHTPAWPEAPEQDEAGQRGEPQSQRSRQGHGTLYQVKGCAAWGQRSERLNLLVVVVFLCNLLIEPVLLIVQQTMY